MLGTTVAQLCEESSPGEGATSCKSSGTDCSQPSQLRAKPWHQCEGEYSPPECLLQFRQQMGLLKRGWTRPALFSPAPSSGGKALGGRLTLDALNQELLHPGQVFGALPSARPLQRDLAEKEREAQEQDRSAAAGVWPAVTVMGLKPG